MKRLTALRHLPGVLLLGYCDARLSMTVIAAARQLRRKPPPDVKLFEHFGIHKLTRNYTDGIERER